MLFRSGQMIVRATPERLAATCNAALPIFWLTTAVMCVLQLVAGFAAAWIWGRPELVVLTASLALVYLAMPPGQRTKALARQPVETASRGDVGAACAR